MDCSARSSYISSARRFSSITPGIRTSPSQTAKSEMAAVVGYQKDVAPFLNAVRAVAEDLDHAHAGELIINRDVDGHLVERQYRRVGLFLASGNQHARLRVGHTGGEKQQG